MGRQLGAHGSGVGWYGPGELMQVMKGRKGETKVVEKGDNKGGTNEQAIRGVAEGSTRKLGRGQGQGATDGWR